MAPKTHRRTGSREAFLPAIAADDATGSCRVTPPTAPPADVMDEEEPELLEILQKRELVELPTITEMQPPVAETAVEVEVVLESIEEPPVLDIVVTEVQFQSAHNATFDKRLPRFMCCSCVCVLLGLALIVLLRVMAVNTEESLLALSPPPPLPPPARS